LGKRQKVAAKGAATPVMASAVDREGTILA
jgi:hypothetical protein